MLHVALCADARMFFASLTVVNSIAERNGQCAIHFHAVHDGSVSASSVEELRGVVARLFPEGRLSVYERVWRHGYAGINPYISRATMLRLLLPELLPVPKVIYLDLDLIVCLDLHELWRVAPGPRGVAMRPEIEAGGPCVRVYAAGERLSGNAGVMVLDLALLRREGFVAFCAARATRANDQSLINDWCAGFYASLPRHCNLYRAHEAGEALARRARGESFILHFNRPVKPWTPRGARLEGACLWRLFELPADQKSSSVAGMSERQTEVPEAPPSAMDTMAALNFQPLPQRPRPCVHGEG
jgi:lipopolysaccharide biosynthesis glycosyltransferase